MFKFICRIFFFFLFFFLSTKKVLSLFRLFFEIFQSTLAHCSRFRRRYTGKENQKIEICTLEPHTKFSAAIHLFLSRARSYSFFSRFFRLVFLFLSVHFSTRTHTLTHLQTLLRTHRPTHIHIHTLTLAHTYIRTQSLGKLQENLNDSFLYFYSSMLFSFFFLFLFLLLFHRYQNTVHLKWFTYVCSMKLILYAYVDERNSSRQIFEVFLFKLPDSVQYFFRISFYLIKRALDVSLEIFTNSVCVH